jgi:hypothetical protein
MIVVVFNLMPQRRGKMDQGLGINVGRNMGRERTKYWQEKQGKDHFVKW